MTPAHMPLCSRVRQSKTNLGCTAVGTTSRTQSSISEGMNTAVEDQHRYLLMADAKQTSDLVGGPRGLQ